MCVVYLRRNLYKYNIHSKSERCTVMVVDEWGEKWRDKRNEPSTTTFDENHNTESW